MWKNWSIVTAGRLVNNSDMDVFAFLLYTPIRTSVMFALSVFTRSEDIADAYPLREVNERDGRSEEILSLLPGCIHWTWYILALLSC